MTEPPREADSVPAAPGGAAEEIDWWLGGPGMRQLGAALLLGAGALFVLAMADRWPAQLRIPATQLLVGLLCFALGWALAPIVTLTDLPVRAASRKNLMLGCLGREIWSVLFCAGLLAVFVATGYSFAGVLGFVGGLTARWGRPLVDGSDRGSAARAASDGAVLAAALLLALAEFAALGLWLAGGGRAAGLAWAGVAVLAPPLAGFALKSRLWPYLAVMLAFATAMAMAAWSQPPSGAAWYAGSGPSWQLGLAAGMIGAVLAGGAVWFARRRSMA